MKQFRKTVSLALITIFTLSSSSLADFDDQRRNTDDKGFSAFLSLNYVHLVQEDINRKKKITSYDDHSKETAEFVVPDLEVQYNSESWSAFVNFESVGLALYTGLGNFSINYNISQAWEDKNKKSKPKDEAGDVYENPFLLNQKRKATSVSQGGYELEYSIGKELNFSISYSEYQVDLDKDLTEELYSNLGRDGKGHRVKGGLSILILSAFQEIREFKAEGKVDSSKGENSSLELFIPFELIGLYLGLSGTSGKDLYQDKHPVFNKTREDEISSLSTFASFDLSEDWNIYILNVEEKKESNIDFFDATTNAFTLGTEFLF